MKYRMRNLIAEVADDDGRTYKIEMKFNPHVDYVSIIHPDEIDMNMDLAKGGAQMIVGGIARKLDKLGLGDGWSVP